MGLRVGTCGIQDGICAMDPWDLWDSGMGSVGLRNGSVGWIHGICGIDGWDLWD